MLRVPCCGIRVMGCGSVDSLLNLSLGDLFSIHMTRNSEPITRNIF